MRALVSWFLRALVVASALVASGAVAQRAPTSAARPSAARGTFEIQTIPPGLAIYVDVDTSTTTPDSGWVPIEKSHPLVTAAHRRGSTPITLRNLKPGRYQVAVSELPLLDRNLQSMGSADPFLTLLALAPSRPLPVLLPGKPLAAPVVGALVYRVTVTSAGPRRLVILSKPDLALSTLDSLYPRGVAFVFDTAAFATEWARKTANSLSPTENRSVVGLLQRGGKCVIIKGDMRMAAEVREDQTWHITVALREGTATRRP